MTPAKLIYSIDVANDDGQCYDLCIFKDGKPIATITTSDNEIMPLVRAGNVLPEILQLLKSLEKSLELAADYGFAEELETIRLAIARAKAKPA